MLAYPVSKAAGCVVISAKRVVRPPTPGNEFGPSMTPPRHRHPRPAPATPTESETSTVPSSPEPTLDASDEKKDGKLRLQGRGKLLVKHLHVPHAAHKVGSLASLGRNQRPSSVRRLASPDLSSPSLPNLNHIASTSTAALSIAPTAVHSHFHSSRPRVAPPPPLIQSAESHGRSPAESRILSNLWLASAATFRRSGKLEQCHVAIEEAETLDPENSDVWVQLGLCRQAVSPNGQDEALPSFIKAILLRPDHPTGIVCLSKLYLATNQVELAHSLLNQLTQDNGWDVPEAWFYLGKACEAQGREARARECWEYALGLEKTRPARRWNEAAWLRG
jgi:tetratricopeptide (TPR) repeat protein